MAKLSGPETRRMPMAERVFPVEIAVIVSIKRRSPFKGVTVSLLFLGRKRRKKNENSLTIRDLLFPPVR
jgi:hypothetical protein